MTFVLEGKSGYKADVDIDGRQLVVAKSIDELAIIAREKGLAFSWSNVDYNYSGADTILAVENNSPTKKLYITKILAGGDTASEVIVHVPTSNVTMAGTAVTGVCLNQASPEVAEATGIADETGNTQGNVVARGRIAAAGNSLIIKVPVILAQDQMVGVDYVTVGAAASVTIFGFFA
tara:strand:+ start:545 stop:1075 length:531 start_codon:yes stop_codon:yes gene_type:complete